MALADEIAFSVLIGRARAGELAALAELLRRHHERVLGYIQRQMPASLQSYIAAEDVLQDVYIEACRRTSQLDLPDEDALRRWLQTIARHRLIELVRAHKRLKRGGDKVPIAVSQLEADEDTLVALLGDLAVHERTPSRSAVSHELIVAVQRAIDRLSEDHRSVIWLRYIDAVPIAQIAERLKRTEGSVHMLANRALKALRVEMRSLSRYA